MASVKGSCPNIILINCDDLGWGDLGCYGSEAHRTPNLDCLAAGGTRFTDFYMASSICSPSRGAMLTGCYPARIGFEDFDGKGVLFPGQACGLNPAEETLATLLKRADYETHMVGKWHCGDQPAFLPTRHGFDTYYGLPYSNDMGRQGNRPDNPPLPLLDGETVIQEQPDQRGLTERYVERATRVIRGASAEKPFFLYFAHFYVHLPHYVPDRFLRESDNVYAGAVAAVDWSVGVLLDELRERGLADNTLVLFTSDNGSRNDYGPSNGPFRGTKGTSWEGGHRVPLLAWWPGRIPAGRTCSEMVLSIDFLPSFAAVAGEALGGNKIDGRDILPLLTGEAGATTPHEAYYYYHRGCLGAIRSGNWKLHLSRHEKVGPGWNWERQKVCELYDLAADIGETRNVAGENPEVVRRLEALAGEVRQDLGDAFTGVTGSGVREKARVENARPLTTYDPSHPYIEAMYDTHEAG